MTHATKQLFQDTKVQITCHGQRHLGGAFGSWLFTLKNMYPRRLRYGQSDEILTLSSIETHPHYMLILHLFMVWYLNEIM